MPVHTITVTTTGSAGAATGSANTLDPVFGRIEAVYVQKHASLPGTTDLTLVEANGPGRTVLSLTNIASSATYYPRVQIHDTAGTAATYDGTRAVREHLFIAGQYLTASLAQSDALTAAVVITIITSL